MSVPVPAAIVRHVEKGTLSWERVEEALTLTFQSLADEGWAKQAVDAHASLLTSAPLSLPSTVLADVASAIGALWVTHGPALGEAASSPAFAASPESTLVSVVSLAALAGASVADYPRVPVELRTRYTAVIASAVLYMLFDGAVAVSEQAGTPSDRRKGGKKGKGGKTRRGSGKKGKETSPLPPAFVSVIDEGNVDVALLVLPAGPVGHETAIPVLPTSPSWSLVRVFCDPSQNSIVIDSDPRVLLDSPDSTSSPALTTTTTTTPSSSSS